MMITNDNPPGLRDWNLAVLVRPGAAAGLGVHTPHQVLDLLDVEAPGDATGYSFIIPDIVLPGCLRPAPAIEVSQCDVAHADTGLSIPNTASSLPFYLYF